MRLRRSRSSSISLIKDAEFGHHAPPSATRLGRVYFGAFDAAGNLYVDRVDTSGATIVGVVAGECGSKAITTLTSTNTRGFPGSVQVTPTGKIAIVDQAGTAIYTYDAPVKYALGTPIATTPLGGG